MHHDSDTSSRTTMHIDADPQPGRDVSAEDYPAPSYVKDLLGHDAVHHPPVEREAIVIRRITGQRFVFLSLTVPNADVLDDTLFEERVKHAYLLLHEELKLHAPLYPVRFWNYVPGITQPARQGLDRYMIFNAGRCAACDTCHSPTTFDPRLTAASAIGHRHPHLVVHVLAADQPGRALENPRQVPAYRYSRRFGPSPPCFARGTLWGDATPRDNSIVFVSGTASVIGEDSAHEADLSKQLDETCKNLAILMSVARGDSMPASSQQMRLALSRYRHLRAYVVRAEDEPIIEATLRQRCANLVRLEMLSADLCRPELLVEIEGLARLDDEP